MARASKKPRLPGGKASKSSSADDKRHKRHSGKPAGSRNTEAKEALVTKSRSPKDPRIGSRKPVPLVAPEKTPAEPLRHFSPARELKAIEQDQRLEALMDKVDSGHKLTAEEKSYVDKQLARHLELCQMLGIETETPEAQDDPEEDLYDRFHNIDVDKFK
ncbi:GTPase-activating protein [Bowmanella dokdonensis]|uniref:Der GTPase-activating protein YihI n=2 Tax=Bowmanella dokdonensis TaxID=751969 RepID=A0A939DPA5_9ALTE|nr:Der GTPase-activating protein YihI [Bowmanella dokdonensis]MBN7825882.1 GTPase-activating protein [Bowmanella dokdonensis]